jgi:outer membrane protein TolC
MRITVALAVLVCLVALGVSDESACLSPGMWERVRGVQPVVVDLTPTPSPEAPATLTLQECIAVALRYNAGFRQDQESLVDAQRGLWVADQRFYPSVSSQAERGKDPGETTETNVSARVEARWEALGGGSLGASVGAGAQNTFSDLFSREPSVTVDYEQPLVRGAGMASSTWERIRSARTSLSAEELSFYDARQDLAQRIIDDYCSALLARGEVEIAERSADRAKRLYDINYAKFSGEGLVEPGEEWVSQVAEIDVDQARLSWDRSKQQVISRQRAYRDAMDRLLLDMGLLPGAMPELTTTVAYTREEYDEAALVETALLDSTELGRLELSREDAVADLWIAESEDRPDVIAAVGATNPGETTTETSPGTGWFAGIRAELPLLDRSREEGVTGAERALAVLDQRIVATRDSVAQEVQRQVRAAVSSQAQIDIGQLSVALARKSREAAQGMYDEGLSDYLRVLDAEDRLVEAERSLLQERVQYFLTTVRLRRALGEDITQGLPD